VQTFNPEHIALEAARDHDYQRLFQELIEERRLANYPPFCQLVNVHVSGEELTEVRTTSHHVAERLRSLSGVEVLGPVASAIEKLQNRWRRHVLVKLLPGADVAPVGTALADLKPKRVNIAIDVDPYSMM
jgi:primosomal protein N' (replication factor Y)